MNNEKFEKILGDILRRTKDTLSMKGKEYGRKDRLHNFKRAACVTNTTPERALIGMAVKHFVSIMDMVDEMADVRQSLNTSRLPKDEYVEEKIGDMINYLILLEAMIKEVTEVRHYDALFESMIAPEPDFDLIRKEKKLEKYTSEEIREKYTSEEIRDKYKMEHG